MFERKLLRPRALAQAAAVAFGPWLAAGSAEIGAGAGVSLGIASAAWLALRHVLQRRYLLEYSGLTLMLHQSAVTALVFAADSSPIVGASDRRSAGLLLLLGISSPRSRTRSSRTVCARSRRRACP